MKTILDYQNAALAMLGSGLADYVQKTAGEGNTHRANLSAFSRYGLLTPPLSGNSHPDCRTTVLGKEIASPVMVAPTAFHGLFNAIGEAATSEATKNFGTIYVISSFSTLDFHQIDSTLSHAWYQLLMYKDLNLMKRYIDKAVNAGCSAIVLTVDAVSGCSMCKKKPGVEAVVFPSKLPIFPVDPALPYDSLDDYYLKYMPMELNWDDVREIVNYTKVPIILKGVFDWQGVINAADVGAKAVIISNHGGRQNDELGSSLDALARLPSYASEKVEIYLDGGIRSGEDVYKAIALGARAVFVGRPILYGLTVCGSSGVYDILHILKHELCQSMVATGCKSLADIQSNKVAERQ